MKSKLPTAYNGSDEQPKLVTVIEEAVDINDVKEYGIGIDVHKLFIMVCVRTKLDGVYVATTAKFPTDWKSLLRAKEWCYGILQTKSDVKIDIEQPLHYVIDSTATYHYPLRIAWGGIPSVINPTIAGENKRKTDKLDAKRLALHDQTAVWRESYVVPPEVEALRLMIAERERYISEARASSNRINNTLTRFGYNIDRYGSVTQNKEIRSVVENQISASPDDIEWICPIKLLMDVRLVMRKNTTSTIISKLKLKTGSLKSSIKLHRCNGPLAVMAKFQVKK
ncbi:MAG: transposase [Synergistaceae bacterium]|nr:transposase [Synergistaceae bacterium]